MKKILLITMLLASALACQKQDNESDVKIPAVLDSNAKLSINLRNPVPVKAYTAKDSAVLLSVIKNAYETQGACLDLYMGKTVYRGINDEFRDTVNMRFLFWGTDVIFSKSELGRLASNLVNVIFINISQDTVAYVPNALIKSIHKRIKVAFSEKNYDECYRIFDTEYIAYPCTGEQYRKMIADGNEKLYISGMVIESWYNDIYDDILPKDDEFWINRYAYPHISKAYKYFYGNE